MTAVELDAAVQPHRRLDGATLAASARTADVATGSPSTGRPALTLAASSAEPRSICLFTPSHEPSGMGEHMLDLAAELAGQYDVTFLCRPTVQGRRLLSRAAGAGARTLELPSPRDTAFSALIQEWVRDGGADVFHTHVGLGWEAALGQEAARRGGARALVRTQHLPYRLSHPRKRAAYLTTVPLADRIIGVSSGLAASYERIGVPSNRIDVVQNGIGPMPRAADRDAARWRLGVAPHVPLVLSIGRLVPMKGQAHLIDAVPEIARRHPDVVVAIVGGGTLEGRLREQVERLGVGRHVLLPGPLPQARELLPAADVFVLPSLREGLPLVALEAMSAALPVVATRVCGTEEVVEDGVTGRLVPAADPGALAVALVAALDDPAASAAQGAAGFRRWGKHFSSARMANETVEVYRAALARGGSRKSVA